MVFPMALAAEDRAMVGRALGLYGPVMLAMALALGRRRERRMGAAVLLGLLWMLPALLALQMVNLRFGWWRFETAGPVLRGMPVELYLGWCCLWGAVPVLAFRRVAVGWVLAAMTALDLVVMPLCGPVVLLGRGWLAGEVVAAGMVLTPGVLIARWTLEGSQLRGRAVMQLATAGGVFLFLFPEIVFALRGGGWGGMIAHGWRLGLALQAIALLALPGVSAVQEFVERGEGTPIPYDPPRRLVVSGIYSYVANPMQLSCTLVMLAWAFLLWNGWLFTAGLVSFAYSAGIARWDERQDLELLFGQAWTTYRRNVRDWRLRWKPYPPMPSARLYLARECGVCSELRAWFANRECAGLELCAAEDYPGQTLRRMRYEPFPGGPAEDGVRALGRALEHLNFGWALVGMAMRLPGLRWGIQAVADGVGFGERMPGAGLTGSGFGVCVSRKVCPWWVSAATSAVDGVGRLLSSSWWRA